MDGAWITPGHGRKLVEKSPRQSRRQPLQFWLSRRSRATVPRLHQGVGVRFLRDISMPISKAARSGPQQPGPIRRSEPEAAQRIRQSRFGRRRPVHSLEPQLLQGTAWGEQPWQRGQDH